MNILEINSLSVSISGKPILKNINILLPKGKVTAIVGESGSGKTMTAMSILRLLPSSGSVKKGSIVFKENDLLSLPESKMRDIRGKDISMVFQEPFTSLNPVINIGTQLLEAPFAHGYFPKKDAKEKILTLLDAVKIRPDIFSSYPHELSGGERQRVMLAMALSMDPDIVILDEPTTALDVIVQKRILDLIIELQNIRHLTILFITHDFSIVNMIADNVCVMRNGEIVESGAKDKVLNDPENDYTKMLIASIPRLGDRRERLTTLSS